MPKTCINEYHTVSALVDLAAPYIPADATRILVVRCGGSSLRVLSERFPDVTVCGINTDEVELFAVRESVEGVPNVWAWLCNLRDVRIYRDPTKFDVVLFLSPAGSYKKDFRQAVSSLVRAIGHTVDILKPNGRIIIVRSKALKLQDHRPIPRWMYKLLFRLLSCSTLQLTKKIAVAELESDTE